MLIQLFYLLTLDSAFCSSSSTVKYNIPFREPHMAQPIIPILKALCLPNSTIRDATTAGPKPLPIKQNRKMRVTEMQIYSEQRL